MKLRGRSGVQGGEEDVEGYLVVLSRYSTGRTDENRKNHHRDSPRFGFGHSRMGDTITLDILVN